MNFDALAQRVGLTRLADLRDPYETAQDAPPNQLLPFMAWCLRGTYGLLLGAGLIAVFSGALEVSISLLLGLVLDTALDHGPEGLFSSHLPLFGGLVLLMLVIRPLAFGATAAYQNVVIGPNVNVLALSRMHRWTMGQAVTFFDNDFAGRISQKQMQTSRAIMDVTMEGLNTVVFALASLLAAVGMLLSIDWRVGVILLLWLIGYLAFIRWFMPRVRLRAGERAGARAAVSGQVVDTITNMRTAKLFANVGLEDRLAVGSMEDYRASGLRYGYVAVFFRFFLMAIAGLLPVMLIGATLVMWQRGTASPGDIVAAGTVSIRIAQMTGWVSFALMQIYSNLGEIEDGMHTLTPPHKLVDAPDAVAVDPAASRIFFDDVTFTYGREKGGIRDLALDIAEGEKVGIVGASGAGKSTLVSLLLRLYDVEAGRVLLGQQDVRQLTQDSLRRQIAMVTQDTAMFNRTAMENIRYGRPDATDAEVIAAAERAEAHEFILGLKDHRGREGYDAFLGERGVKLSGGQRQRIALARAILKDAPVLVLDEATSALDSEVEAAIQTALTRVMEGKTVLAIAHRLSTIAQMDRIIVLEAGRLVEQGTHADLLAKGGVYARYWHRQSGGFADAAE
ncbi:MAG: ABC transporter ATP-binding protein [Mangrovicoccus sp.]